MITFVDGDVWSYVDAGASLAHGCNVEPAVMGAGIAKQVRERYPTLYRIYRAHHETGRLILGTVLPVEVTPMGSNIPQYVFNLMTQPDLQGATYDAVYSSLSRMKDMAGWYGVKTTVMPRIASDLGGLRWPVIKAMLLDLFDGVTGVDVIVVENYVPQQASKPNFSNN